MKYSSIVGGTTFMAALHLTEGNTDTTRLIPERPSWIRNWSEIARHYSVIPKLQIELFPLTDIKASIGGDFLNTHEAQLHIKTDLRDQS